MCSQTLRYIFDLIFILVWFKSAINLDKNEKNTSFYVFFYKLLFKSIKIKMYGFRDYISIRDKYFSNDIEIDCERIICESLSDFSAGTIYTSN